MRILVCEKWEIDTGFGNLRDEGDRSIYERSYGHFLLNHPETVAAKCLATEWLINGIIDPGADVVEYMGGVGIQSVIIKNLLKPGKHLIYEIDSDCCELLGKNGFEARVSDFCSSDLTAAEGGDFSAKFVDFPSSSAISIPQRWPNFHSLFNSRPSLVVWTDTSVARPIQLHGSRYSKVLNCGLLNTHEDYVRAYSRNLYDRFEYTIARAAFRARDAVYFAALPGEHETLFNRFPLKGSEHGLKFLN